MEHSCETKLTACIIFHYFRFRAAQLTVCPLKSHMVSFKILLIYISGGPFVRRSGFCSAERNRLCNCGRGHYGEHSCEII